MLQIYSPFPTINSTSISMISSGKAVGMDPIKEKWTKSLKNAIHLAHELNMIIGGFLAPSCLVNRARMMLLSKESTSISPINRFRPIQMYSPVGKGLEAQLAFLRMMLNGRPQTNYKQVPDQMQKCTPQRPELSKRYSRETGIQSGSFVDFTEAFNRIHQQLLVNELRRWYQCWALARRINSLTKEKERTSPGMHTGTHEELNEQLALVTPQQDAELKGLDEKYGVP